MKTIRVEGFLERLAEELVLLYLRLNGYLMLGGYLLHRSVEQREGLRTEIDALAVRFPNQREPLHDGPHPEQPNDPLLVLPRECGLIDFVVAEVKTGKKRPRFNDALFRYDEESRQNLLDVLSMLGCFAEESELREAVECLLAELQSVPPNQPIAYMLKDGRTKIRFLLFWDPSGRKQDNRFFISLSHVLEFVEMRTRPGTSCAAYSRWHAKWRGLARHILEAMDEVRSKGKVHGNLKHLEEHLLHRLGSEAVEFF